MLINCKINRCDGDTSGRMIIRKRGGPGYVGNVIRDPFEVYKLNIIEILAASSGKRDSER